MNQSHISNSLDYLNYTKDEMEQKIQIEMGHLRTLKVESNEMSE